MHLSFLKTDQKFNNEFLLKYKQFIDNYLIYSFPVDRMLKYDSRTKSIDISCSPDDNDNAIAIIIYQQSAYVNLKIENGSLVVKKTYQIYYYNIWMLVIDWIIIKLKN